MRQEYVEYTHGKTLLEGFFACDDASAAPKPGVLIAHAWGGRTEFVIEKAKELAALGYAAFALDNYGKGVLGSGPEENSKLMAPFLEDRGLLRDRLTAGLDALKRQSGVDPSRVAIMGYCFGGLCALDLARSGADIRGAVSFHGLLMPPGLEQRPVKAKVSFSKAGLSGSSASPFGEKLDCPAPRRVLVRVRALATSKTELRRRGAFLSTNAPFKSGRLAVRTERGKPIVYAEVLESGASRLYTAKGCVYD